MNLLQIAEGRKNEGEEKKKMEGEIETLKNEVCLFFKCTKTLITILCLSSYNFNLFQIKMINERNEKVAEEKRVEIEALKSKVCS